MFLRLKLHQALSSILDASHFQSEACEHSTCATVVDAAYHSTPDYKQQRGQSETSSFGFLFCFAFLCVALTKTEPGKPNKRVSISQGRETTGNANCSPQTVNNANSSVPPPPHLSRSVAEPTGTCPSAPL